MKTVYLKCENCGAFLEYPEGRKKMYCQYCGIPILLEEESLNININSRSEVFSKKETVHTDEAAETKWTAIMGIATLIGTIIIFLFAYLIAPK